MKMEKKQFTLEEVKKRQSPHLRALTHGFHRISPKNREFYTDGKSVFVSYNLNVIRMSL
jgi:hypothetical protein